MHGENMKLNTAMLTSVSHFINYHPQWSYHTSLCDTFSGNTWINKTDRKVYYVPETIKKIYTVKARELTAAAYVVMYSGVQI